MAEESYFLQTINLTENSQSLDKELSWGVLRAVATQSHPNSNKDLAGLSVKAAKSIVKLLNPNLPKFTDIETIIHGSCHILSKVPMKSGHYDKYLTPSTSYTISSNESKKLFIQTLPDNQRRLHKDGVKFKVKYDPDLQQFSPNYDLDMEKHGVDSVQLFEFLSSLKEFNQFNDKVEMYFLWIYPNISFGDSKKPLFGLFPCDNISKIKPVATENLLLNISSACKEQSYCTHGKHFVNGEKKGHNLNFFCPIHSNKFVKTLSYVGDWRKNTTSMIDPSPEFKIECTATMDEIIETIDIKEEYVATWLQELNELAAHLSPIDFLVECFKRFGKDINSFNEMFDIGSKFALFVNNFYEISKDLNLIDTISLSLYNWMFPISNEDISEFFNQFDDQNGLIYQKKHEDCQSCQISAKFYFDGRENDNCEIFIATLKRWILDDEVLVYHGFISNRWLDDWVDACDFDFSSPSCGDFHFDESAIYFQYTPEGSMNWAKQLSQRNAGYILACFALKKEKLRDSNRYHLFNIVDEWKQVVKGYRTNNRQIRKNWKKIHCLEGPMVKNGSKVCNGEEPIKNLELGDQICVKDSGIFEEYFRFMGVCIFLKSRKN